MSFSLLPDLIFPALTDVTPQALMARGIELLLLDFDNTIVPYTTDVPTERMETWLREMQKSGIRLCVVSNSKKPRVQVFCKAYSLDCITRAKKSIAGFHIRQGMGIGCKVTLRGDRMWEFLDRLLSTALPRVRDFRGISPKSFDGRGNYSLGITEQLIFPEIEYDKVDRTRGMDITFVTTAGDNERALALLTALGFPFKQK